MQAQSIFLRPEQVPYGMLAYVCAPGTNTPETDESGTLLPPLMLMIGGVPLRAKWYIVPDRGGLPVGSFEYDAIRAGAHFTPAETFSANNAPVRRKYAVFVSRQRLKYDDYPREFVEVAKVTDGRIVSFNGYAYEHWLCEFELPKNAVLVQIGGFAAEWDFAVLGCIGIPKPTAEQRMALEKLGVVFFDHAPFPRFRRAVGPMFVNSLFRDYVGVRLPPQWTLHESGGWLYHCPYRIEIRDPAGNPIARIHQEPSGGHNNTMWTGRLELV